MARQIRKAIEEEAIKLGKVAGKCVTEAEAKELIERVLKAAQEEAALAAKAAAEAAKAGAKAGAKTAAKSVIKKAIPIVLVLVFVDDCRAHGFQYAVVDVFVPPEVMRDMTKNVQSAIGKWQDEGLYNVLYQKGINQGMTEEEAAAFAEEYSKRCECAK